MRISDWRSDVCSSDLIDSLRLAALAGTSTPGTAAPQPAMGGASPMSAELAQIDAAIASAAARLGPNHPQMQALRKQRALTQAQLARERAAASAGAAQAAQAGTAIMPGGCSPTF